MSKSVIKIGILGCGTVGSGLVKLINKHQGLNPQNKIEIKKIFVRNEKRAKELSQKYGIDLKFFTWDANSILTDPEISIVVELMGGVELSKTLLLTALEHGKNIVTANKDLLAIEGEALFEAAKKYQKTILYEAAVAGGIPIISTLKQSLQGNRIEKIFGIINGTTNYILDVMKDEGKDFAEALKLAQGLGFAEADPTNDIDGHDAAYKTAILGSIISNKRVDVNKVYREGIRNISSADLKSAEKRGYEIKLLGIIDNSTDELDLRVHPVFVSKLNPLASVKMENNAILINGDAVKELTIIGKGAGSLPTASSVFGDILILASQFEQGAEKPNPQFACMHTHYAKIKNFDDVKNSFYVRVSMYDKVGVLKDLGEIMANNQANVKFIDQYDVSGEEAHGDFIIDPISEKSMKKIISEIKALDSIKAVESVIRVL